MNKGEWYYSPDHGQLCQGNRSQAPHMCTLKGINVCLE